MKKLKAILTMALSLFLAAALSGCQPDPTKKLMFDLIEEFNEMTGKDAVILNDEYSEKLDEMCRNIYINNSRFALPMRVSDLPGEFNVKLSEEEPEDLAGGFVFQTADLFFRDDHYCRIYIWVKENNDLSDGIILALIVDREECKSNAGDFDLAQPEEIRKILGEPSEENVYGDEPLTTIMYISKNNGFLLFESGGAAYMAFHA